jgi:hypothetical protein
VRLVGLLAILGMATTATLVALADPNPGLATIQQPGAAVPTDLVAPDPDLAVVAGLARGPSILGIAIGDAPRHVLAVPADAPADLGALMPTGREFPFTDPNGNAWVVTEYRAAWGYAYGAETGPVTHDPDAGTYNFALMVDTTLVGRDLRVIPA